MKKMTSSTSRSMIKGYNIKIIYKRTKNKFGDMQMLSSKDCYDVLKDIYKDNMDHYEAFNVMLLDTKNSIIDIVQVGQGNNRGVVINTNAIFQAAILANADKIILSHNHPSGNLTLSDKDKEITTKMIKSAKLMDKEILDHIVISRNGYVSMADEDLLK